LTGAGNVALNANTLTVGSTNNLSGTFGGVIADGTGAGGLTKAGTGTFTLTGANTYSGGTTLNAGTLNINNASAIGTGTFTVAGGAIDNTSGAPITLAGNNAQAWNGDFAFGGTNALNMGTGAVTLGGAGTARTVTTNGTAPLTVGGAIGGTHGLTKAGGGTLILAGNSTYTGPTAVNAGTLRVNGNQSAATGAVTAAGGATLGGTGTIGGPVTFSAGATVDPGASVGTLTVANDVTINGGTNSTWVVEFNGAGSSFPPPANTPNDRLALTEAGSDLNLVVDPTNKLTFSVRSIDGFGNGNPIGVPVSYTIATKNSGGNFFLNGGTFAFDPSHYLFETSGFDGATNFLLGVSGDQFVLTFTPVPEPGGVAAAGFGLLAVAGLIRRRLVRRRLGEPAAEVCA
jgi:autotransporter-associated beta strand protein